MFCLRSAYPRRASINEQQLKGFFVTPAAHQGGFPGSQIARVLRQPVQSRCLARIFTQNMGPIQTFWDCRVRAKWRLFMLGNGISPAFLMMGMCALDI